MHRQGTIILGIDQSTSATKALLFSEDGALMHGTTVIHEQIYPQPGWVEHDAEAIWQNLLEAVKLLFAQKPEAKEAIQFVSITNQRETFVIFEKTTGNPIGNAIVWQCTRSEGVCDRLKADRIGERIKAETGLALDSYFSAPKLKWWVESDPAIAAGLQSGDYLFGTIDTYLIYRLTRGAVYATDHTNASRTMLYSLITRQWERFLCDVFGVKLECMPEIRDCDATFGETTFEGQFSAPISIQGVMGDSQAALFAQRCFSPGSVKVTFGTGSSMLYNIGPELVFSKNGIVTALASVVEETPSYCFEGIIRFSSAIMDWMQKQLGLFENIREADKLAEAIADSAGVIVVPAFTGLGAPYWNARAKAAIVGMTAHSGKSHIIRAGFEAMAFQVREVLEMMEAEVGIPCSLINVDGGPTKSPFLMQLVADILQRTIRVSSLSECSAQGAVMAGMLGAGTVKSLAELETLPRKETYYRPTSDPETTTTLFERWKTQVMLINKSQ